MNVNLFYGYFKSNQSGYVSSLTMHIKDFKRNGFVSYLQLYVDNQFIAEAPVFEGKAVFSNLHFSVNKEYELPFVIKGKISNNVVPGDIERIGFIGEKDLIITDVYSKLLNVCGDYPLYGNNISIVGNQPDLIE